MEDERLARLERELDVPAQVVQLDIGGRQAPVVVETRLTDGASLGGGGQRPQSVAVTGQHTGREMRVHADRRIDAQGTGQLDARHGRRQVPPGCQEPLHACLARGREHECRVGGEGVRLEMAMGVDKTHHQMLREGRIARTVGSATGVRGPRWRHAIPPRCRAHAPHRHAPGHRESRADRCCRSPGADPTIRAGSWPERLGAGARLRHRGERHHVLGRGPGTHPRDGRGWRHTHHPGSGRDARCELPRQGPRSPAARTPATTRSSHSCR